MTILCHTSPSLRLTPPGLTPNNSVLTHIPPLLPPPSLAAAPALFFCTQTNTQTNKTHTHTQFNALVVTPILERVKTAGMDKAKQELADLLAEAAKKAKEEEKKEEGAAADAAASSSSSGEAAAAEAESSSSSKAEGGEQQQEGSSEEAKELQVRTDWIGFVNASGRLCFLFAAESSRREVTYLIACSSLQSFWRRGIYPQQSGATNDTCRLLRSVCTNMYESARCRLCCVSPPPPQSHTNHTNHR